MLGYCSALANVYALVLFSLMCLSVASSNIPMGVFPALAQRDDSESPITLNPNHVSYPHNTPCPKKNQINTH